MTSIGPSHVLCCRRAVSRRGAAFPAGDGLATPDTLTLHFGTRPDLGRAMVRARWMALFAVVGLAYLPRLDDVCGLFSDDAWYVLLARALATGEGYTLTNLPTPGVAPVYPPGFPLLLSLVFRMAPDFPGNVVLLKAV